MVGETGRERDKIIARVTQYVSTAAKSYASNNHLLTYTMQHSTRVCTCKATGEKDVAFKVLYCGICHSDLHMAKNEWGMSFYPLVPGGCSHTMVTDEHFIVRIFDNLPLDATAHLLCVGIIVYNPLRYYGFDKPSLHIGVVGLGGLGHVC
ncbi:hypothetical protein PVK06_043547 [Gossypium arboreum]|uniref:Mannitol dehydrogenase n=1 Tax=Gossypium arboreum TaxID=29729 RepID=A0ABR0MNS5_GOSAR|nr:hypothetical protein PVK06_043547 [Gossypium arboreum]